MSGDEADPARFYGERIPEQWNRALDRQEALGEAGRRVYEDMRAVDATIRVEIAGEGGGTFFLNVEGGRMQAADRAARPPFMTLMQDRRAFERLAREAGESAMAMLGGLSGLAGEMHLTRSRLENLTLVKGLVHFEVTGAEGFALRTHFGDAPIPPQPDSTIRVEEEAYRDLRSGALEPQTAFLNHQIVVEGDMQAAMQLALAAVAPD
jgi:putative sterol carrier protein